MIEWIGVAILVVVPLWIVYVTAGAEYLEDKSKERGEWPGYEHEKPVDTHPAEHQEEDVVKQEMRGARTYGIAVVIGVVVLTVGIPLLLVLAGLEWLTAVPTIAFLAPVVLIGAVVWLVLVSGSS